MPPKVKTTKEMITDAGFGIVRTEGAERMTVRGIAESLHCSTQPILYHFKTVEEIRQAVYEKADAYHSEYLKNISADAADPMLCIGMNYIRFAAEEKNLFRFLFQTNEFQGVSLLQMVEAEALRPMLELICGQVGCSMTEAKETFAMLAVFVHGYASFFANNDISYCEEELTSQITKLYERITNFTKENES